MVHDGTFLSVENRKEKTEFCKLLMKIVRNRNHKNAYDQQASSKSRK